MLSAGSFKSIMLTFNFFLLICALNSVGSRAEDDITTTPISLSATMTTATIASTEETSSSSTSEPTSTLTVISTASSSSTSEPTSTLSTEDPSLLSSSSASQERDGTSTTASAVTSHHTQITTDTTLKETVSSTQQDNTSPNTKTLTSDLESPFSEILNSSGSISNTGSEISTTESTEGTAGAKFKERSGIDSEHSKDNNKHESQDESSPAPTKKPEKSKTVLAALLTVGLLLAAMIIAGYFLSHKQKWSPKPKRLEETDQNCVENGSHGGKLVSVNSLEPEDQQDKSNLNGGAQENGNSEIRVTAMKNERSNKQADTEL